MKPRVVVERMSPDQSGLSEQILRSFSLFKLNDDFNKARAVFLKPNLTFPDYKQGVTTRKEFVEPLVRALRGLNETTRIYVGEGEGGYNSFSMTKALHSMGFFDLEKTYSNVRIVNLSNLPRKSIKVNARGKDLTIDLPSLFFDEIDFSITCPLPKVHCMTGVTLSFKNQWGCLPDTMRLKYHYIFDEIISQVCDKLKFRYAFLDGKFGLDNNGPMMGDPVEVDWFAASNSLGAFDLVISGMMGFNWQRIGHLKAAARNGYLPGEKDIEIIGDTDSLRKAFTLKRSFWNYPALAAFHSKNLTKLFYFSKLAKPLHDIMYTFRKKTME